MFNDRFGVGDTIDIVKVTNPMKTRKLVAVGGQ
jgi:hypothetical protein